MFRAKRKTSKDYSFKVCSLILNFTNQLLKSIALKHYKPNYLDSLIAAWAAARRAIGTRKGEQDT